MSPRRPLILRRRKQKDYDSKDPVSKPASSSSCQCFPDGIRIMDHPSSCDTQVVIIPESANLCSVIGALMVKGKESGPQGPNKFILLGEDNGTFCPATSEEDSRFMKVDLTTGLTENSFESKPQTAVKQSTKDSDCNHLNDSLTNIQWLEKMITSSLEPETSKPNTSDRKNQIQTPEVSQAKVNNPNPEMMQQLIVERPPYTYMAMIQFAINSRKNRKMTLKEIYMWIEENFAYYRTVAKPGWKNSIRHNLSLHEMFIREAFQDGKGFYWMIRPEANRCLTLDQVCKPGRDSMAAAVSGPKKRRMTMDARKTPSVERRMKPLLPQTDSYLVPVQLPINSSVYLPAASTSFTASCSQQKQSTYKEAKGVRIAQKVSQSSVLRIGSSHRNNEAKIAVKQELSFDHAYCKTPKAPPKTHSSSLRCKQRLVHSRVEEPVLVCNNNTYDSGMMPDSPVFQELRDSGLEAHQQDSSLCAEPWKMTSGVKEGRAVLEVSPIRSSGEFPPRHVCFNNTPFKQLLSPPGDRLSTFPALYPGPSESPLGQAENNRSITEGPVLDTLNESLTKVLVDISPEVDDEDLDAANIGWSDFLNQLN